MRKISFAILSSLIILGACNKQAANKNAQNPKGKASAGAVSNGAELSGDQQTTKIDPESANVPKPATFSDKFSYLKGYELGLQFKEVGIQPNIDYFAVGMKHGFAGKKDFMTQSEMASMQNEVMKVVQDKMTKLMDKKKKEFEALGKKSKADGEAFLKKIKASGEVKSSPSGLLYKVIKEGSGKNPLLGDMLMVHIKGSLIDGTVFDNNFGKQALPMILDKNIMPAWREALLMMKPGEILKVYAPSDLAFGAKGIFPQIPPHTAMVFELEIVENKGKAPKAPSAPEPQAQ
jgi:FKBP-type peptidyl-prolyl cis-trans isomerase FklB